MASFPTSRLAYVGSLVAAFVSFSLAQIPVADYTFQNDLQSSVGTAPALMSLGTGNVFKLDSVDKIETTVYGFSAGNGVALDSASKVFPDTTYTIVVFFKFDAVTSWRRIIDFKNRTSDNGLYSYYAQLQFYGPGATGINASIQAGSFLQVVLTRDAAKNVIGYVNGSQQISFVDNNREAVVNVANTLSFFRDDLVVPNENSAGAVARITIFNQALTPDQVALLSRLANSGLQKPVITSPLQAAGIISTPFTYQIIATNSPVFFTATGLPTWASLNNTTGAITGTPSAVGITSVSIGAINAAGAGTNTLSINIGPVTGTLVAFSQPVYSVREDSGSATILVRRLGAGAAFSVNYAAAAGTATEGADFQSTSGTLTFSQTDSLKSFNVPIVNDTVLESTEQLTLTLSNPTNGVALATPYSASLSIFDNDLPSAVFPGARVSGSSSLGFRIMNWQGRPASWMRVCYTAGRSGHVSIALYDSRGRLKVRFIDGFRSAGAHTEDVFIPALAAGVYYMQLCGTPGVAAKRILVVR